MNKDNEKAIGVIGLGWVGLVTSVCFAELGYNIVAHDILQNKIKDLKNGKTNLYEPDLPELLSKNKNKITFTTSVQEVMNKTEIIFICVDTPPTQFGDADLSKVFAVISNLQASTDHILVMKSTVPPGTGNKIKNYNENIVYVSCPEFLKEGSAIKDFMSPDRVVIGTTEDDKDAGLKVAELYSQLNSPIIFTDLPSAEMIKIASNAFLATKISFINEIANVCEKVDANIDDVAFGMGSDTRIGNEFLKAGIGYGGSCFPKDVSALKTMSGNFGYYFQTLNATIEVNEMQKRSIINRLKKQLGNLHNKQIGLLGMSFKPNTDDIREAPSVVIANRLKSEGAKIVAYDPVASNRIKDVIDEIEMTEMPENVFAQSDAVVLITEWSEFRELNWENLFGKMLTPIIIDGRNCLDKERLLQAGFLYQGIGR